MSFKDNFIQQTLNEIVFLAETAVERFLIIVQNPQRFSMPWVYFLIVL